MQNGIANLQEVQSSDVSGIIVEHFGQGAVACQNQTRERGLPKSEVVLWWAHLIRVVRLIGCLRAFAHHAFNLALVCIHTA